MPETFPLLYHEFIPVLAYLAVLLFTLFKILTDTQSSSKTLAYILLVIIFPVGGIIFYYWFGINYRHIKKSNDLSKNESEILTELSQHVDDATDSILTSDSKQKVFDHELVKFAYKLNNAALGENACKLMSNGEEKFPEVLSCLDKAISHIHMEYYAWENDLIGNRIKDVLIKKYKAGVKVRVMYDAFASRKIRSNIVKELRETGIEIHPVIKLKWILLANRINHRDHRKVIVIDGKIGFVGGINISDRYDNSTDTGLYWRDTHIKIEGKNVLSLQRHFIINWNSCQPNKLTVNADLFPDFENRNSDYEQYVQIVAGGPIYKVSNVMLTYFKLFVSARKSLFVSNPYFIPNPSILDALKQAAYSGIDVKLILPFNSDSKIVGAASKFYFKELLNAGVRIFLYKKGFLHAKTVVVDGKTSVVGTANLDIRSFDLNFEIMALIYGRSFAKEMESHFENDLKESIEINRDEWNEQSSFNILSYSVARLLSNFL